eukprot:4979487-Pleurochrysis_carterae.AAC.1
MIACATLLIRHHPASACPTAGPPLLCAQPTDGPLPTYEQAVARAGRCVDAADGTTRHFAAL